MFAIPLLVIAAAPVLLIALPLAAVAGTVSAPFRAIAKGVHKGVHTILASQSEGRHGSVTMEPAF